MGKFNNVFIVSDIDHTFLADDRSVPQKNLDALSYFKSEGGQFTFATGRSHHSLLQAFPNAAELLNAPAILGNGSYLYDYIDNKLIYPMYLEKEIALKVAGFILNTCPDTGMRILTSDTTLYTLINSYISYEMSSAWYQNISKFQSPEEWTGEKWCKIVIRDDPDKLDKLRALMETEFAEENIEICKSEADFLEIQSKGCNKGRGIEMLRESCLKQGKKIKIYACGDYENDLAMLKVADVAVCPSNASEEVKKISDLCLCSCNDGLIANLIEIL